jgi:serine/threonine protein kinase
MDPTQGPPQPDHLIGQTIGNYLVTQKVGEGGMGSVYLAEHPTIGKKVALKVLHPEFSGNEGVAERFFNEAKAVNNIGHPNIVDIVDYGVIQTGVPGRERLVYFIMEYLPGNTLSQLCRAEAPLPPERALSIAMQVADALSASHRASIIHRDLKPDNVMLQQRGRERDFVKLLDFGIAKLSGDTQSSHRTSTNMVMGTPAYMSPEQCEGKASLVDGRTDVYALGVVLYEMLTGRVPFIGEGYGEILMQHLTQHPIPPSQFRMIPPHVEVVVLKALEKRPDMRYPTMDEFMRAMADPVGYVEAHGGCGAFLQRQLMPSTAPLPPVNRLTPGPFTPVPGTLSPPSGIYGQPTPPSGIYGSTTTPAPTTLGAAAGEVRPARGKTGFLIAGVLVLAAAGGAIAFVMASKGKDEVVAGNDPGSDKIIDASTAPVVTPDAATVAATTPDAAVAVVVDAAVVAVAVDAGTGSADTDVGPGSGSAVTVAAMSTLTLTSAPSGAAIWIDGKDTGKRTPSEIEIEKARRAVTLTFKLPQHDDLVLKKFSVMGDVEKAFKLRKKTAGTPGRGSGSGRVDDTKLERPE